MFSVLQSKTAQGKELNTIQNLVCPAALFPSCFPFESMSYAHEGRGAAKRSCAREAPPPRYHGAVLRSRGHRKRLGWSRLLLRSSALCNLSATLPLWSTGKSGQITGLLF